MNINFDIFLFYTFAIFMILSALMVIFSINSFYSIIFLILAFFNSVGLLLILEVEFLAFVFVIIYVGAIAVLFLFVVMMLNLNVNVLKEKIANYLPIGIFLAIIFLIELYSILGINMHFINFNSTPFLTTLLYSLDPYITWFSIIKPVSALEQIGFVIYTFDFYLFLLSGCVLFVAMVGAIVLTLNFREDFKRQNIFSQIERNFNTAVQLKK